MDTRDMQMLAKGSECRRAFAHLRDTADTSEEDAIEKGDVQREILAALVRGDDQ